MKPRGPLNFEKNSYKSEAHAAFVGTEVETPENPLNGLEEDFESLRDWRDEWVWTDIINEGPA